MVGRGGQVKGRRGKVLRPSANNNGYLQVTVVGTNGEKRRIALHRLMALVFLGPKPGSSYRLHFKNGDRANCSADNLEWRRAGGKGTGSTVSFYLSWDQFDALEEMVAEEGGTRSAVLKEIAIARLVEKGYLPGS